MKKEQYKDFEAAMAALEQKVKALEEGNLPLDDALRIFEEGMAIATFCSRKLKEAEGRVEILLKGADGEVRKEPFPPKEEEEPGTPDEDGDVPF